MAAGLITPSSSTVTALLLPIELVPVMTQVAVRLAVLQKPTMVPAPFLTLVFDRWVMSPDWKVMVIVLPAVPDSAPVVDVLNPIE